MRKTFYILAIAAVLICTWILLTTDRAKVPAWNELGTTVVVDAGHGGEDGGAVSIDGVMEKTVNLEIAQKCDSIFTLLGVNVVMTRNADVSLDDGKGETVAQRKAADIHKRTELANNAEGVLVSIHMNSFTNEKYWGTQCFYSPYTGSQALAECIQEECLSVCESNTRVAKPIDKSVYILNNAKIPAVIVECGFLSNRDEAKKLVNEDYQKKIAMAICTGTMKYINGES